MIRKQKPNNLTRKNHRTIVSQTTTKSSFPDTTILQPVAVLLTTQRTSTMHSMHRPWINSLMLLAGENLPIRFKEIKLATRFPKYLDGYRTCVHYDTAQLEDLFAWNTRRRPRHVDVDLRMMLMHSISNKVSLESHHYCG